MKKLLSLLLLAALLTGLTGLSAALADGQPASATTESVSGNANVKKTFYVYSLRPNASVDLNSYPGLAKIRQHAAGGFTRDVDLSRHGMYTVREQGSGLDRSFLWIPEAASSDDADSPIRSVTVYFPSVGLYSVTVEPLVKPDATNYWHSDALVGWSYPAVWNVSNGFYCGFSSSADKALDGSNLQNNWWYTAAPTVPPVTPAPATPVPVPTLNPANLVSPFYWDTYFRPETCKTSNANAYTRLKRLYDGNPSTCFEYIIWSSEWEKTQFYAYFNYAPLSGFGLVNGNASSAEAYNANARVRTMQVTVHSLYGDETFDFTAGDYYSPSPQYFSFGRAISGVTQVDIHITGTYNRAENHNNVCIADICFYQ